MDKKQFIISLAVFSCLAVFALGGSADRPARQTGRGVQADLPAERISQKMPPGIMFATILNNVKVEARGGWLKLSNQIQNVFMPDGSTGRVVLAKANGSEFIRWDWGLDQFGLKPPYKLFAFRMALKPDGSTLDVSNLKLTAAGTYALDFYLGDKKFYTFPFSVTTLEPANAFDGETMYFTEGAWNDWGYLNYRDADPENNLFWKIWLREKSIKTPGHKIKIQIIRDADKKVICQNRDDVTHSFQRDWARYEFDMVNPPVKTSSGDYFKAKDLLAVDGGYTLKMNIDGKEYGTWKFSIVGGKPNYSGRTDRGKADPLTFVEGGKDAFWYERVK